MLGDNNKLTKLVKNDLQVILMKEKSQEDMFLSWDQVQ